MFAVHKLESCDNSWSSASVFDKGGKREIPGSLWLFKYSCKDSELLWGDFSQCVAAAGNFGVHLVYSQLAFYLLSASLVAWSQGRVCMVHWVFYIYYIPGWWRCFGSSQDHQSRCRFALCGEAEDTEVRQGLPSLLLNGLASTGRKSKSTRRRAQAVEPGPKLRTIRSLPHQQKSKGYGRPKR